MATLADVFEYCVGEMMSVLQYIKKEKVSE